MIKVNEVFHNLQGEGPDTGKPAIFLRLSGCNLACKWCDSPYTWNGTEKCESWDPERLAGELNTSKHFSCRHLVVTGGEPLIQQKDLEELFRHLGPNWTIKIETNGSIEPEFTTFRGRFNVSPKLENSGNEPYDLKVEPFYPAQAASIYKFVATDTESLARVREYIVENKLPSDSIWIMPEGVTVEAQAKKADWIVDFCKQYNYNFATQLHIMLWGNKRAK